MGLLYALLEVAPNSKLQSIKVVKALQNLYEARDLPLPMLGGHHKVNIQLKNKICRMLTQTEILRLGHTLDKMDLILGYVEETPVQIDQSTPPLPVMDTEATEETTPEPIPATLPNMPSLPNKKSTISSLASP